MITCEDIKHSVFFGIDDTDTHKHTQTQTQTQTHTHSRSEKGAVRFALCPVGLALAFVGLQAQGWSLGHGGRLALGQELPLPLDVLSLRVDPLLLPVNAQGPARGERNKSEIAAIKFLEQQEQADMSVRIRLRKRGGQRDEADGR